MLATQDVWVSNDLLSRRLLERRRVIDLQEVAFAREAAEFAASDAWDEDGSVSAIDWIRFNCHMTAGAAANAVAVGEALPRLPESHQALVDGEIGFAHLAVMARTAEALRERFDEKVLSRRRKRIRRASSSTSATTPAMRATPRPMPPSRRSRSSRAGSS